jgi:glycosyltransferase A (GT-A) superfamily protein (DUF2064 family)
MGLGWRWSELTTRWDVDRPQDLTELAQIRSLAALLADLVAQPAGA